MKSTFYSNNSLIQQLVYQMGLIILFAGTSTERSVYYE